MVFRLHHACRALDWHCSAEAERESRELVPEGTAGRAAPGMAAEEEEEGPGVPGEAAASGEVVAAAPEEAGEGVG